MGNVYPAVICALVLIGAVTGLEYYFNFFVTALVIGALLTSRSVRPVIVVLCTYVFQISLEHSFVKITDQGIHASNYYFSGWRIPVTVLIAVLILGSLVWFFVKNKIYKRYSASLTCARICRSTYFERNILIRVDFIGASSRYGTRICLFLSLFLYLSRICRG